MNYIYMTVREYGHYTFRPLSDAPWNWALHDAVVFAQTRQVSVTLEIPNQRGVSFIDYEPRAPWMLSATKDAEVCAISEHTWVSLSEYPGEL